MGHAPITETIPEEGRGLHDQVLTVLNLGIRGSNAVDVQLGGIGASGQKAKGGGCHQQLLNKLHGWEEIKKNLR